MNFVIIIGIVLVVAAIVIYATLYFTNRSSNIDTTYSGRFYGGKLKGGSSTFRFIYFILGLCLIIPLIYGFNLALGKIIK